MSKYRGPYAPEFRQQIVDLVHTRRRPDLSQGTRPLVRALQDEDAVVRPAVSVCNGMLIGRASVPLLRFLKRRKLQNGGSLHKLSFKHLVFSV